MSNLQVAGIILVTIIFFLYYCKKRSQQRRFVRYDPIACDELVCANPRPLSELINAGIVFRGMYLEVRYNNNVKK